MAAGAGSTLGAAETTGAGAGGGGGVRETALGGGGGGGGSGAGGVGAATKSTTSGATSATASRTEAICINPQAAPRWARQTPATSPRIAQAGNGVDEEPLASPVQRGVVKRAVRRRASSRSVASWEARVSILPRPIIRVTAGADPAMATTPTARTVTATSTSMRVNPQRERFTW